MHDISSAITVSNVHSNKYAKEKSISKTAVVVVVVNMVLSRQ